MPTYLCSCHGISFHHNITLLPIGLFHLYSITHSQRYYTSLLLSCNQITTASRYYSIGPPLMSVTVLCVLCLPVTHSRRAALLSASGGSRDPVSPPTACTVEASTHLASELTQHPQAQSVLQRNHPLTHTCPHARIDVAFILAQRVGCPEGIACKLCLHIRAKRLLQRQRSYKHREGNI